MMMPPGERSSVATRSTRILSPIGMTCAMPSNACNVRAYLGALNDFVTLGVGSSHSMVAGARRGLPVFGVVGILVVVAARRLAREDVVAEDADLLLWLPERHAGRQSDPAQYDRAGVRTPQLHHRQEERGCAEGGRALTIR